MTQTIPSSFELRCATQIPLRDGIRLHANVYTPKGQGEPAATIVALTPYSADSLHQRGVYFASHGFPFLAVDVRGRGNSAGTFRPNIQEAADGYDVIEWVARQSYCNGKVAMWGASYLGYAQWAAAKERPPHLATIVPTAAPYVGVDFPMRNNIFYPYVVRWLSFVAGRASQANIFADEAFWSRFFRDWHQSGRAFCELDVMLGERMTLFQEWISHPDQDAYWASYNPTPAEYASLEIPILTITGSYDDDQPGALEHYKQHRLHAAPDARNRHYLIIGPWDHAGTATPQREIGGLTLGAASLLDLPDLHRQWYAWTLQGGPKPEFLRGAVAYYVMAADRWRYAESLEAVTAAYEPLFLESSCNADDIFHGGVLTAAPGRGQPDSYVYDPAATQGLELEAEARADGNSLVDQSVLHALRGKSLVYHSAPFQQDTEISGFFRLLAWIEIDCPDTDIYASVHEIALDGSSVRLTTDAIRARYREAPGRPKAVRPGEVLLYQLERFTFVSRQVSRGHRLRLVIAPIGRIIGATFAEKNFNAGGCVARESVEDARPVKVKLFHDPAHPSALYVPLGQTE